MDSESFKTQCLPLHRKLYMTAFRLLEDADDAEDMVQEAYARLWEKRDRLPVIVNLEAFCIALVRNLCLDMMRSAKYQVQHLKVTLDEAPELSDEVSVEGKEDVELVRQIISALPDLSRKVVIWRDVKGCSLEEIEQLTGLTAGHVRVVLSRARKKIRDEYYKRHGYER